MGEINNVCLPSGRLLANLSAIEINEESYFSALGRWNPRFARCAVNGEPVSLPVGPAGFVDVESIERETLKSGTFVLEGVEHLSRQFEDVLKSAQEHFDKSVHLNMYYTPANAKGWPPHSDPHDVVIFQMFGQKNWYVYPNKSEPPASFHLSPIRLSQNQSIVIPKGQMHAAYSGARVSIHLTIGVH